MIPMKQDIEIGEGVVMRITKPRCPCGGEYVVKDGSIVCRECGEPIHSEPAGAVGNADDAERGRLEIL